MAIKHQIQNGDTRKKYEEHFGVSWEAIQKKNPDIKRLTPGNFVMLPITKVAYEKGYNALYKGIIEEVQEVVKENTQEIIENALCGEDTTIIEIPQEQANLTPISNERKQYKVITSNITTRLNIRKEPTTNSDIIGTLFYNEIVEGKCIGDWIQLDNGYILASKTEEV